MNKDKKDPLEDSSLESSKLDIEKSEGFEKSEGESTSSMTSEQRLKYLEDRIEKFKKISKN